MLGTNASTVTPNVSTVFLAIGKERSTIGHVVFINDEPEFECQETKRVIKCCEKTHEQLGCTSQIGNSL